MSDLPPEAEVSIAPSEKAPPRTKAFRKKFATVRLAPDAVERQGKIALLAWKILGGDAAAAFLNNPDERLGGRPLDLATASVAGFEDVERAMIARAAIS